MNESLIVFIILVFLIGLFWLSILLSKKKVDKQLWDIFMSQKSGTYTSTSGTTTINGDITIEGELTPTKDSE